MYREAVGLALVTSLVAVVGVGCVNHDRPTGCTSNDDCRGERVCHAGSCRFASAVPDASIPEDVDESTPQPDTGGPSPSPDDAGTPPPPDEEPPRTDGGEPDPPRSDAGGPTPVDAIVVDDSGMGGTPDGNSSCRDIVYCSAIACEDDDDQCLQSQLQEGTPEGRTRAREYFECVESNNCESAEDSDTCREENCGEAESACIDIPDEGDGLSCSGVLRCLNQCERGDRECPQDCFRRGTRDAQEGMRDFIECNRDECRDADGTECLRDECGEELEQCFGCSL